MVFNNRNAYCCNNWKLFAKSPISKKSTFRCQLANEDDLNQKVFVKYCF